ncbi:MAG: hypothetical protein KDA42_03870 [Planctomycetales bacterium]|nr:hypothetical protein [Planctomycetales bacterium]
MSAHDSPTDDTDRQQEPFPPVSWRERKQLQQHFEAGCRRAEVGQFDGAIEMFSLCLQRDPGNLIYGHHFLKVLGRKFAAQQRPGLVARLKVKPIKKALAHARTNADWTTVLLAALDLLRIDPGAADGLTAMAGICLAVGANESQIFFLEQALATDPQNSELKQRLATALRLMGEFDRAKQHAPGKPKAANTDLLPSSEELAGLVQKMERLESDLASAPGNLALVNQLADLHLARDRPDFAEQVLAKALTLTGGGDLHLRTRLEDCRIAMAQRQLATARLQAEQSDSSAARRLVEQMETEANRVELEVFAARCQRNPSHSLWQFELGLRLKRAGKFQAAIAAFEQALDLPGHKSQLFIELGECWQHLRQFDWAFGRYIEAVEICDQSSDDIQKLALYRAGTLAMAMEKWAIAGEYLRRLAELEPGFKDVAARLDKLAEIGDKG